MAEKRDYSLEVGGPTGPIFVFISSEAIDKMWGRDGSQTASNERLMAMDKRIRDMALQRRAEGRVEDDGSIFFRAGDVDAGFVEFDLPHGMARTQRQFEGMVQRVRVTRAALLAIARAPDETSSSEELYDQSHLDVWMALPDPLPPTRVDGAALVDVQDLKA